MRLGGSAIDGQPDLHTFSYGGIQSMNRQRKMKPFTMFICLSLFVMMLAACSKSDGGSGGGSSASPAASGKAANSNDLGGITIRIAGNADYSPKATDPVGAKKVELQKQVEQKYNVKIQYVVVPQAEFMDKMKASILNGNPMADIVYMGSPGVVPTLAQQGMFIPIDELIDMKTEKQIPVEDFKKLTSYKNKTYGFGTDSMVDSIGIWYNRALFKNNGLPDPHEWVNNKQWTWAKFREVAKQLTKDTNGDGKPDQWGLVGYAGDWVWFNILANNGTIYDIDSGQQKLNDPKTIEAMDFMAKLFTEDKVVGDATWGFLDLFPKGNIGMVPGFSWEGGTWKEKMKQDGYGFLPMPLGPNQTDYVNPARQVNAYFIPKGVKNPQAVIKVWKELQVWDKQANFDSYNNAQYANEDDIAIAKMLQTKVRYDYFAGVQGGLIDTIGNELAAGKTTAAQVAQTYGPKLQDKIDVAVKQ